MNRHGREALELMKNRDLKLSSKKVKINNYAQPSHNNIPPDFIKYPGSNLVNLESSALLNRNVIVLKEHDARSLISHFQVSPEEDFLAQPPTTLNSGIHF
jgi:hypothetical protein